MGCKTSGGRLFCNDRSGAENARHPGDVCSAPTEAERRPWTHGACSTTTVVLRKMGRVRSGGPHATSRPSRRRDLEPWAPAPQQPKPCGRWVARRPGGTSALQRPKRSGDRKTSGGTSVLQRPKRSGDLGPMGTRSASASKIKKG